MDLRVIQAFAAANPELANPQFAKNRCIDISMQFLAFVGIPLAQMGPYLRDNDGDEFSEHHWVCIDGMNIDWTAAQFGGLFPTIWLDNE